MCERLVADALMACQTVSAVIAVGVMMVMTTHAQAVGLMQ